MSVWIVPRTWTPDSVLAAADLDAEVRDPLTWLHSAMMSITDGTIADDGVGTYMAFRDETRTVFLASEAGDSTSRIQIESDGTVRWGDGGGAGTSATIYFEDTRVIALEDTQFRIYRDDPTDPGIGFRITGENFARVAIHAGFIDILEGSDQASPDTGRVRIYARDNGGKTQVVARFDDDSVAEIVIQP